MPAFNLMGKEGSALLDSALALPRQSAFGEDAYPSVLDKAAVLFRSLVRNHCLVDGNKRLATAAAFVFLMVNGWLIVAYPNELLHLALRMASPRGLSWRTVSRWLRGHTYSVIDPHLGRTFFSHLEVELQRADAATILSDADLRQAAELFSVESGNSSIVSIVRLVAKLRSGIEEGELSTAFLSMIRRSLEATVRDLKSK